MRSKQPSVRPPHLPDATALELLRQRAQVALDTWIGQWAVGQPPPAALTVSTAIDHDEWQGHAYHRLQDTSGALWIRANVTDRTRLTQCIIGPDREFAPAEVIEEIIDLGAVARADELWAALFGESTVLSPAQIVMDLPAELFASGSGAVQIVCNPFGLRAIVRRFHV